MLFVARCRGWEQWNAGIVEYWNKSVSGGTSVCSSKARRRVPLPKLLLVVSHHSNIPEKLHARLRQRPDFVENAALLNRVLLGVTMANPLDIQNTQPC